jgi:hypothetical protein
VWLNGLVTFCHWNQWISVFVVLSVEPLGNVWLEDGERRREIKIDRYSFYSREREERERQQSWRWPISCTFNFCALQHSTHHQVPSTRHVRLNAPPVRVSQQPIIFFSSNLHDISRTYSTSNRPCSLLQFSTTGNEINYNMHMAIRKTIYLLFMVINE